MHPVVTAGLPAQVAVQQQPQLEWNPDAIFEQWGGF
jgi:hypothetical protein